MITVRLWGGLGNQMFQYGFGRRLAAMHGAKLTLDLGWFKYLPAGGPSRRNYELGAFELDRHIRKCAYPAPKTQSVLPWRRAPKLKIVAEKRVLESKDDALSIPDGVWLLGYWQSERYFCPIADDIRAAFRLRERLTEAESTVAEEIATTESVSLHVRRGDYADNPQVNRVHGLLSLDYYRGAMELMSNRLRSPTFFVFSDDPAWAKQHLEGSRSTVVVTTHDDRPPAVDMHLMSRCRHHVIANSSFSWWGAWLGETHDTLVVAPRAWLADPAADTSALVPSRWLRI